MHEKDHLLGGEVHRQTNVKMCKDGQQIPQSGLALWLRADSITVDNGDTISEWKDQSGDGRDFTQTTASKKPTFVATDATFNNRPCLSFDGGDQLTLPFDVNLNTNEFTIFMVMSVTNDNDANQLGYESRSSSPGIELNKFHH